MERDSPREDLPRISVDSARDWKRVKSNYRSAALSRMDTLIQASDSTNEREAIRLHLDQLIEDVFSIARPNLRVNGRNFEDFSEREYEVEAFDEALDRHIWSLSDQRLKCDKVIASKRRTSPQKMESHLECVFAEQRIADEEMAGAATEVGLRECDSLEDNELDKQYAEVEYTFLGASALSKELNQVIPVQHERSERVQAVANEVKTLKP